MCIAPGVHVVRVWEYLGTACPHTRPAAEHLSVGRRRYPQSWGVQQGLCLWVAVCGEILVWGGLGAPLMRPRDGMLWGWIGPASIIPINKGNEAKLKRNTFLNAAGSSCFLPPSLNTVFSSNEGPIQSNNETLLTSQCFKCHFPFPCRDEPRLQQLQGWAPHCCLAVSLAK